MQLLIMKADTPPHSKGDIVEIRATGTPFAGKEVDYFVVAEVPDVPMTDFVDYSNPWKLEIGFAVVAQDTAIDGYRLRLFSELISGVLGVVSQADVEQFIQSWGGAVHSVAANEVIFDITIYAALTSPTFWDIDISQVVFTELAYDETTGIHRIQADYSALANNPTYVERYVAVKGLSIVSHADKKLVYDADRAVVRTAFQEDIKRKSSKTIARRRYYVGSGVVDYIVANGGMVTTDRATLESYVQDKVV